MRVWEAACGSLGLRRSYLYGHVVISHAAEERTRDAKRRQHTNSRDTEVLSHMYRTREVRPLVSNTRLQHQRCHEAEWLRAAERGACRLREARGMDSLGKGPRGLVRWCGAYLYTLRRFAVRLFFSLPDASSEKDWAPP